MALSSSEINIIHTRSRATPGRKYYGDDGKIYIGTANGRLKVLDTSDKIIYKKSILESIVDTLITKEVEIDFGSDRYQRSKVFTVLDLDVDLDSRIQVSKSLKTPSDGRDSDEVFIESLDISVKPNVKSFDLYVKSLSGTISGKFIINYSI